MSWGCHECCHRMPHWRVFLWWWEENCGKFWWIGGLTEHRLPMVCIQTQGLPALNLLFFNRRQARRPSILVVVVKVTAADLLPNWLWIFFGNMAFSTALCLPASSRHQRVMPSARTTHKGRLLTRNTECAELYVLCSSLHISDQPRPFPSAAPMPLPLPRFVPPEPLPLQEVKHCWTISSWVRTCKLSHDLPMSRKL